MSILDDIIEQGGRDYLDIDSMYDPDFQGNMYMLDEAMRLAGVEPKHDGFSPSAYDMAITKLINSIPLE